MAQYTLPCLDQLAGQSVVFDQAYCAMPVCTPSRASFLTGVYPHTHGTLHYSTPLPAAFPTIAEVLSGRGYTCGYAGKWHLGGELQPQRGFAWWSSTEDQYVGDHGLQGHRDADSAARQSRHRHRNTVTTWSHDDGRVWQACGPAADFPALDPSFTVSYGWVYELSDGRLLASFFGIPRGETDGQARTVLAAFSSDRGHTWPDQALLHDHDAAPDLSCSETDLLRLPGGRYRDVTPGQYGVGVGLSRDDGETWQRLGYVYRGPNKDCAYPSPVRLSDGTIFTPYYTSAEPEPTTGACEIHGVCLRERDG